MGTRGRPGWNATAAVVLASAAIACANIAAARLSLRFDLTQDRVYTLSPASRALVSGLPDQLTVKAYISRDLPPPLDGVARYTLELLEEYRLASGGTSQRRRPLGRLAAGSRSDRSRQVQHDRYAALHAA